MASSRFRAAIFGASGGIGAALADALEEEGELDVVRLARTGGDIPFDITDETSISTAVAQLKEGPPLSLAIVATGLLHRPDHHPEKSLSALNSDWMTENFRVNSIGPALVAKHVLPLLPRDQRSVFAVLSARVGSISDNQLGGWYSYRASKAALNQLVRCLALEHARTHKRGIVVALHPGTVDTALSRPFQGNVAAGKLFPTDRAALQLMDVIDGLTPADSGKLFAWDGAEIAP